MDQENTGIELRSKAGEVELFDYGTYAGQGTQNADKGARVPFLQVLQPLSKALQEGHERYVEGAKAGMILIGDQLIDGKKGEYFIGIEETHVLVEKTKLDGTGEIVGEHEPNGVVAQKARAQYGSNKYNWRSEKGNFLVERFNIYGMVFLSLEDMAEMKGYATIVGFERSKIKSREHLMSPFNKLNPKSRPPLFAVRTKLTTAMEKGKKGDYYNVVVRFADNDDFMASLIRPTDPLWATWAPEAAAVAEGVRAGKIRSSSSGDDTEGSGEDTTNPPF